MSDDGIQVWAPMEVVEGLLARAEKAEAAIKRVRELLAHPRDYRGNGSEWNECRDAVLRALDGDSDE